MAFVSVNTLLNRAFYSIQKPWVPLIMGVVNLALNAGLDLLLYKPLGVGGITLSTSLVSLFNFFALMFLLSPRIGGVDARRVAWSAARSISRSDPAGGGRLRGVVGLSTRLSASRSGPQIVSVGLAYRRRAAWPTAWPPGPCACPNCSDVIDVVRRRRQPRSTEEVVEREREG